MQNMHAAAAFFDLYPYLGSALIVLTIFMAGLALFPSQREPALWSAFFAAPSGLLGIALVPDYWQPWLVVRIGRVGPEDFIWAFATGGLVWLTAIVPLARHWRISPQPPRMLRRYLAVNLIGAAVFIPLWLAGVRFMPAYLLSGGTLCAWLVWRQSRLWPLAVSGGVNFAILHVLVMKSVTVLWPSFVTQWTTAKFFGVVGFGLPLEEITWGFVTGTVWATLIDYVLDAGPRGFQDHATLSIAQRHSME